MNYWPYHKLGTLCRKITDGSHYSPAEQEEGYPMLSVKDMRENGFDYSGAKLISDEDYRKIARGDSKPLLGDVLIAKDGSYLKHVFVCRQEIEQVILSSIAILRPNSEMITSEFLAYVLSSEYIRESAANYVSGAALPRIILDDFKKVNIPLPPLAIQQKIVAVLGRYDALLENYQQQVAALEGLAQEVYREWFVRGRCPGAETGPEGELPAGWRIATLDEVAYDTRRIVKIDDIDPDAAYVGLEHLSVKSISITATGTPDDISSDKLAFEDSDILFGKIRAYLHKVCLAHFAGVCSTDAIVIRPRIKDALSFVLFTVFSERFIEYADLISNGTKMPRSEWSVLKTYEIILPDNKALAAFEEVARPMLDKIANLQKQSNYLRATRDALLPRLLSGQLTVHKAEATIAA